MKVQTKILLLLLGVLAVFVVGLAILRARERGQFRQIALERATERQESFSAMIERHGVPLEMFAKDLTYSDEMVQNVGAGNESWIRNHIDNDQTWARSDAQAVWIYRADRTLLFSANRLYAKSEGIPLPAAAFDALEQHARLMHFFLQVPQGIMEIRAATIHPSNDAWRQTPPQGFFFAGKLWSSPAVAELGRDSDNFLRLLSGAPPPAATDASADGIVSFTYPLPGWDGQPVGWLQVRNDSKTTRQLNHSSDQLMGMLVGFALLIVGLLLLLIVRWVSRPLHLLSQTLKTEQLAPLDKLRGDHSEFGVLAQLIRDFFRQRESLIAEVNERKNAQEALRLSGEQLRQAQKMEAVGRLAGGVAHDFNNLLTAILGYAELLASRHDLDAAGRQNVEMIQKAGRQAAAVTHQLLAFSRKQMLQPRVIDLNALVMDFEKILRRVIGEHIELHTVAKAEASRVRADPNQIEQVILNLGVNARDAMPRGGRLTIRTAMVSFDEAAAHFQAPDMAPGRYVLLEVSDTGEGMDDEVKNRIFEPFFTTKGPGKGTGLGLSTVYGVVKQSGGTIAVESTPGSGCTFRIYLPLDAGELEEGRPKTVVPIQAPEHAAETVLVVEDEEIVRELVCTVLSNSGYDVLCAPNGMEAVRLSETHPGRIALLITDVVMPHMGGLELARRVTLQRPDTRVLYVSGYSEDDMSAHGIPAELEFLEKPFTPHTLTRKVRELLYPPAELIAEAASSHEAAPLPVAEPAETAR